MSLHYIQSSQVRALMTTSLDLLTQMLESMRTQSSIFAVSHILGTWGFSFCDQTHWGFHLVLHGGCWMHVEDNDEPVALEAGDLVLPGRRHALTSSPQPVAFEGLPDGEQSGAPLPAEWATSPERTTLLCGAYTFPSEPFWRATMPQFIHIKAAHMSEATRTLIALLHDEVREDRPGAQSVRQQLLDTLLIHALRHTLEDRACETLTPKGSWLSALDNPQLSTALAHIHQNMGAPISLEELCQIARMSRASFARHFTDSIGVPPMTYVTQVRMRHAHKRLSSTNDSLEEIASEVGYANAFALSKAFKRVFGRSPSSIRAA